MKRLVKTAIRATVAVGAQVAWRFCSGSRLAVLMYHRVLPEDHPARRDEQPGMCVSPRTLAMHLEVLKRNFTLMHLDDWVRAADRGEPLPRMACAITFDDGWRDNFEFAYPVLSAARAPATIYLVSDLVGTSYSFWPNTLARLLSGPVVRARLDALPPWLCELIAQKASLDVVSSRGLVVDALNDLIERCKASRTDAEMMTALSAGAEASATQTERDLMSWPEIREMAASGLIRFGSHTRRHTRLLDRLPAESIEDEVATSAQVIEREFGQRPGTFCYPNGDYGSRALEAVRRHYAAAVTTRFGWNSPSSDRLQLRRIGVHDDISSTPLAFIASLAGI